MPPGSSRLEYLKAPASMKRFATALLFGTLLILASPALCRGDEAETFHALLESEWNYVMEDSPTYASMLGDRRWNDRWGDSSAKAMNRRAQHGRDLLKRLAEIDASKLNAQ